jgi:hypothetical protein
VAPPGCESERYAQQVFESQPQLFPAFGRYKEKHKPAASCAQKLAAESASAVTGLKDFVQVVVGYTLCQGSLDLPRFVQQMAELCD